MKFGIYSNVSRDKNGYEAIKLADALYVNNVEFALSADLKEFCRSDYRYFSNENLAKNCDVMIIFGGDGTVLHYGKVCAKNKTPVFPVKVGRIGFLTEFDTENLIAKVLKINKGNYLLEERNLLKINFKDCEAFALNDCVIHRDVFKSLIELEFFVNGAFVAHLRGDALVISTPTGSTAYSLSGGGPIISPEVKCMLLTPICPYTLFSKPLIVGDSNEIRVVINPKSDGFINIDGEVVNSLEAGNEILINRADTVLTFIRLNKNSFYEKISQKNKTTDFE